MHFRTIVTLAFAAVGIAAPVKLNKDELATSETPTHALNPAGEVHIARGVDADTDTTADWQKVLAEHKRKRQEDGPPLVPSYSSYNHDARNLDKADAGSFDDNNSAAPHDPVVGSGTEGGGAPQAVSCGGPSPAPNCGDSSPAPSCGGSLNCGPGGDLPLLIPKGLSVARQRCG